MQEGHAASRGHQINRHTVGDRHSEQDSGCGGNPTVDSIDLDPAATRIEAHELDPVDLVAQSHSVKAREPATKREPPAHDLADRLPAPESEIEAPAGLGPAAGDAGDYAVTLLPAGNLEPGNISNDGGLSGLPRL
jgi:hypothetical protein